jgi:hypothetical protein
VKRPAQADFEMKNLSVVRKGYHSEEKVVRFYYSGDQIKLWAPRARSPPTTAAFSKLPQTAPGLSEAAAKTDGFLVMARGSTEEMARAH